MALVACPSCGEEDRLRGERRGESIHVTCEACGCTWERDVSRRCYNCGSEHLRYTPVSLFARGRGTMQTPVGAREAWTCEDCGTPDATRKPESDD